ncbi:MAG: DUF2207 domain-containing protein [Bacilli bacterium]|nr:DUF2207 domain-containing protein [Bacilli bacterium]MDD4809056.1 DUF2207 domain-containing protein [Bacilli bacterium]
MKCFKRISLLLVILLCIFLNSNVYAQNSLIIESDIDIRENALYEYTINSYDIDITVNENNSFNIKERIGAYFNIEKHGIFRKIPLRNEIVRLDGTSNRNRATVKNITVDEQYTISNESGYRVIKIGNPNQTLTGSKDYAISYLYNIGKDKSKDYDEFYFNIIGNEWDTIISDVSFKITMPKEFDASKLGFSSGRRGLTNSDNILYQVDGNIITGIYKGDLNPGEAITVRLELPEGYFVVADNGDDLIVLLSMVLPIVFALITFLLWYRYGKDNQVIETVEFYPPEGFNSAEIGFLYKGRVDRKDVVSLLIYLANKGYLKIAETENKVLFSKIKSFKIIKLKDYDGDNINEELFLKGLFAHKNSAINFSEMIDYIKDPQKRLDDDNSEIREVTALDLQNHFYRTINNIMSNINNKENKEKIFEKSSLGKRALVIMMIVITFVLITIKPSLDSGEGIGWLIPTLFFPGIGFSFLFAMVFSKTSVYEKIFGLIWGLGFGGMPWAIMVLPMLLDEPLYLKIYMIGLVCILVMIILFKAMPKRTKYGNEILGKIRGFKRFLETAEKQNLEAMVMKNPTYFYDILPFTYVLGVSSKWIKKFESISMQAPNWYDGYSTFDVVTFSSFMNSTMASASSSASSSSSGSSGGGSSGGGSGGGGGGSW